MIELAYSLVIEATDEPDYFGFYSPELEGFSGIGHSIEDCLFEAKWGMKEHVELLKEQGLPVPARESECYNYHTERKKNCCLTRNILKINWKAQGSLSFPLWFYNRVHAPRALYSMSDNTYSLL